MLSEVRLRGFSDRLGSPSGYRNCLFHLHLLTLLHDNALSSAKMKIVVGIALLIIGLDVGFAGGYFVSSVSTPFSNAGSAHPDHPVTVAGVISLNGSPLGPFNSVSFQSLNYYTDHISSTAQVTNGGHYSIVLPNGHS